MGPASDELARAATLEPICRTMRRGPDGATTIPVVQVCLPGETDGCGHGAPLFQTNRGPASSANRCGRRHHT